MPFSATNRVHSFCPDDCKKKKNNTHTQTYYLNRKELRCDLTPTLWKILVKYVCIQLVLSFVSIWPNMWNDSVFRLHNCTLLYVCVCVAAFRKSMNASWWSAAHTRHLALNVKGHV